MEKTTKRQNISAIRDGGFVALITAVLLTVLLLVAVSALNENGFFVRTEVLDSEYKSASYGLAEACVSSAILSLAKDPAYAGSETISIASDSCDLDAIQFDTPAVDMITISASAIYPSGVSEGATTKIEAIVDSDTLSIVSWGEAW